MKTSLFFLIIIQTILMSSCQKEKQNLVIDDAIQAGDKTGAGIEYYELEPDINCTITNPWQKMDTVIHLDLDEDGVYDFTIRGNVSNPMMLGAGFRYLRIAPFLSGELCINPTTNWLDTIPHMDTINMQSNWSTEETLIYSYEYQTGSPATTEGHWANVNTSGEYYIGVKIKKPNKTIFGWIGMRRDVTTSPFNFILTDYALLKEYSQ